MTEGSEEKGFGDLDVSPEAAEKLNEAMKERLDGRVEELLGERETDSGEEVSRRSFIKKLGLGAMGVGLASLIPSGSAYNIRSSDGLEVWGNGTKYFDVNPSGPVEVKNADLRLATGQFIEDGGGTNRLELNESYTSLHDQNGDLAFFLQDGLRNAIRAYSNTPVVIQNRDTNNFDAVKYKPSSSAPGTLELTKSQLSLRHSGSLGADQIIVGGDTADSTLNVLMNPDADGSNPTFRIKNGGTASGTLELGTNINLRLATGRVIEDGGGTNRLELNESGTFLHDQNGDLAFVLEDGLRNAIRAYSNTPVVIQNRDTNNFDAVKYKPSSSAPGTLELTNADLEVGKNSGGSIKITGELTENASL